MFLRPLLIHVQTFITFVVQFYPAVHGRCTVVVSCAHMAIFLASDWFSLMLTGNATADHLVAKGLRAQPEVT